MVLKKRENITYMPAISKQISSDTLAVVIVAAGKGERMGGELPKQYQSLGGVAVLRRSVEAMAAAMPDASVWVVIHPQHEPLARQALEGCDIAGLIDGGETRQASVARALAYIMRLPQPPQWVMVHDGARPMVDAALVQRVWEARQEDGCVVPACRVVDSLKRVDGVHVRDTVAREGLVAVQTPQLAPCALLHEAHQRFCDASFTDDAAVIEAAGGKVRWVEGSVSNVKLTNAEDKQRAERMLAAQRVQRVGMGYDVHPLVMHEADVPAVQQVIMLGGVAIPYEQRCKGHSDADVILHAVVDALLGAIGEGDIGQHFPPSDMRWKGADSAVFVAESMRLLRERGGVVDNLDVTYIGEVPRLGAYREAIRVRIAQMLDVAPQQVNIKATTTEKLGFEGRREGVASQAVVMVSLDAR